MKAYYVLSEQINTRSEILSHLNIDDTKVNEVLRQDFLDASLDNFGAYLRSIYTVVFNNKV